MHEAKLHEYNSWLTLTYNDDNLHQKYWTGKYNRWGEKIYSGNLYEPHMQKFIRALRKKLTNTTEGQILHSIKPAVDYLPPNGQIGQNIRPFINSLKPKIRYYYAGEYGEKTRRPHYHICLFGIDFADKKFSNETELAFKLYTSDTLTALWKHGTHMLGDLTWETAAYTARYIMKKITGEKNKKHYTEIDKETGEIITLRPEYTEMSTSPGLAKEWYEKYKGDIFKRKDSYVLLKGTKTKPPRYYDKLHEKAYPNHMAVIKLQRIINAKLRKANHTPERLKDEEIIVTRKTQSLQRKL